MTMGWSTSAMHAGALCVALALGGVLAPDTAAAQSVARGSQALSNASGLSALGSGLVVQGSLKGVQGSAQFIVESVERSGELVVIVLRGASEATRLSIQVAGSAVAATSLAVGATVIAIADATGWALRVADRVLAYVPNEYGASMVHQSRRSDSRP